jgi:hypothetical protein
MYILMRVLYKSGIEKIYKFNNTDKITQSKEELEEYIKMFKNDTVHLSYQEGLHSYIKFEDSDGWRVVINVLDTSEVSFKIVRE